MSDAIFPSVVRFFHKVLPYKFRVNRKKIASGLEGDCSFRNGIYYIRVHNELNDNESINCLLHELAHIGTMNNVNDLHSQAWSAAYSKIYNLFEKEFT